MPFSDKLRQLRKEKRLTQLELAKAINVTDRSIKRYEAGTVEPTLSVILALAAYFKVSLDYLCDVSDIRTRQ